MSTTQVPKQLLSGLYPQGVFTLTDAATVAIDASLGDVADLSMGGDRTLGAPTNPTDGQKLILRLKAVGGTRAPTFNAIFRADANTVLPTSIASGKTVLVLGIYNLAAVKWDVPAVSGEL